MAQAQKKLRIVFQGTPDFAATILKALHDWPGGEIVGVYTQPDRPCGRGQVCTPSPVKLLALQLGLPVSQPENFKNPDDIKCLADLKPDVLVVAAYGLILPQKVLDIAPLGAINVHASLLPKWRGAAPIQRAIMNGDLVTGITIMQMVKELDAGPILLQRALGIDINDTAETLHDELAKFGGALLVAALEGLVQGALTPIAQDSSQATLAPKLTKDDGRIRWDQPARKVHNQIRGCHPWPGTFFDWTGPQGKSLRLTVFPGQVGQELTEPKTPGEILGVVDNHIAIACQDRAYLVPWVKPAGGKLLNGTSFACGYLKTDCTQS